jgi:hypothetical protein
LGFWLEVSLAKPGLRLVPSGRQFTGIIRVENTFEWALIFIGFVTVQFQADLWHHYNFGPNRDNRVEIFKLESANYSWQFV